MSFFIKKSKKKIRVQKHKKNDLKILSLHNVQHNMKKVYEEQVDLSKLHYIIANAEKYNLGASYVNGSLVAGDGQLKLLKEYAERAVEKKGTPKGQAVVLTEYFQKNYHGRQYVTIKVGLQNLARPIRHTICKGILRDFDIDNAHPTFLQDYCTRNNIPCQHLTYYIQNRNMCLKEVQSALGVSRDEAKRYFLKQLNKDTQTNLQPEAPDCLRNYMNQMTAEIIPKCAELNPNLLKEVKQSGKEWNQQGSIMNRLLGDIENRCLKAMEEVFIKNGVNVASLAYDGAMIYDPTDKDYSGLLQELSTYVKSETGIQLNISEKIMNEGFDLSNEPLPELKWEKVFREKEEARQQKETERLEKEQKKEDERIKKRLEKENLEAEQARQRDLRKKLKKQQKADMSEDDDKEYYELKEKFDRTHFKIVEQAVYIHITPDKESVTMSRKHLMDAYEHMTFGEDKSFIARWLKDETIPKYRKMDVIPTTLHCPDDIYNLWKPFACEEPYDAVEDDFVKDGVSFMIGHIEKLIKEERVTDYLIKWIAHLLRFPQFKNRMITLIAEQGAGKNTVVEMISGMIGTKHVFSTSRPSRDVWGQFNDQMSGNTYLVVLEELSKHEQKDSVEHIKALLTEPWLPINPKGQTPYVIRSYHKFIALTNNEEPTKTSEQDRRNIIIRCSDDLIGNTEHFNRFYELLENKDVMYGLYKYFINYKPDEVKKLHQLKNADLPITEYQKELAELTFDPLTEFVKWMLATDVIEGEQPIELTVQTLISKFADYSTANNIKYEINSIQMGVRLRRLKIQGILPKRKKFGMVYEFNPLELSEYFEQRQK